VPPGPATQTDAMDFAAAATIPVTFVTAMYALGHLAKLAPGERVKGLRVLILHRNINRQCWVVARDGARGG
jgi:NADPH:quinone reductase-like Zn-dependent oxidoreductase